MLSWIFIILIKDQRWVIVSRNECFNRTKFFGLSRKLKVTKRSIGEQTWHLKIWSKKAETFLNWMESSVFLSFSFSMKILYTNVSIYRLISCSRSTFNQLRVFWNLRRRDLVALLANFKSQKKTSFSQGCLFWIHLWRHRSSEAIRASVLAL